MLKLSHLHYILIQVGLSAGNNNTILYINFQTEAVPVFFRYLGWFKEPISPDNLLTSIDRYLLEIVNIKEDQVSVNSLYIQIYRI